MFVCIVVGLLIVGGALVSLHYDGSYTQLYVDQSKIEARDARAESQYGQTVRKQDGYLSYVPLLILWGGVGAIAYSFTSGIFRAFRASYDLNKELDYVNADRRALINMSIERLIVRVVALLVWFVAISYSVRVIIPYIVSVSYASTIAENWMFAVGYVLFAFLITVICVHLHTILLRLVALRPRLFGNT
jgi:hypothetical protein